MSFKFLTSCDGLCVRVRGVGLGCAAVREVVGGEAGWQGGWVGGFE